MKYEVCYMNILQVLTIIFYKTEEDYNKDRPVSVYIITPRRNHKLALEKARIAERKYPKVEIKILYEGKDKERIDQLLDLCLNSKEVVSPSYW